MADGIKFKHTGKFSATLKFFNKLLNKDYRNIINSYGMRGVKALSDATPKDTGLTADSWTYELVENKDGTFTISWINTNKVSNNRGYEYNLVVLIENGHATRSGGWVEGRPFTKKVMKPIMDELTRALVDELNK